MPADVWPWGPLTDEERATMRADLEAARRRGEIALCGPAASEGDLDEVAAFRRFLSDNVREDVLDA